MKRIILLALSILFMATTFLSDNPPGWYQQTLPVGGNIQDIFFLDSLNGWTVTNNGYILNTTNGGDNWNVQMDSAGDLYTVQFLDSFIGYVGGSSGGHRKIYKTTNGGGNWFELNVLNPVGIINEVKFINKDTGWVCSEDVFDGGVFKTTNGGTSWSRQLNYGLDNPERIFFINKDTGWASGERKLHRTINGGENWNQIFTSAFDIESIFFLNGRKGWMRGGPDLTGMGVSYTTDGGLSWISSHGNIFGGYGIEFVNDSIGYAGTYEFPKVLKSTDGGKTWGYQIGPIGSGPLICTIKGDSLNVWAGSLMHTTDGGGMIVNVQQISNEFPEVFFLHQNYPNPFNPITVIKYQIMSLSKVELKVFDIAGKEIKELVNETQSAGTYEFEFDGSSLSSGIYFYRLEASSENDLFIETKKMILTK